MTAEDTTTAAPMARRTVLAAGVVGVAGAALAACGGSGSSGSSAASSAPASAGGASAGAAGTASGAATAASQVPTGGAAIISANDTAYVVAQPTEGTFVAHSAVCPHQGCLCTEIVEGKAVCPCHGSEFNVETGAVEKGPATEGLAPADVTVEGGSLVLS